MFQKAFTTKSISSNMIVMLLHSSIYFEYKTPIT